MAEDEGAAPVSDATWRNRFFLMFAAQVGGAALGLFGILLWQTSYIVAGGSVVGFVLAFVGLAASFFVPRTLARRWKQQAR